jgi:hypothetical protein
MLKLSCAMALSVALAPAAGWAACSAIPYNLANGTAADATQVMADFNGILGCGRFTAGTVVSASGIAESLSFNPGSVGFNRETWDGTIYTPSAYAFQLQHIGSGVAATDYLQLQVYNPSGGAVQNAWVANGAGQVSIDGNPTTSYTFYVNGSAAGAGNWVNASDGRLKKHITPLNRGLALVEQLNPRCPTSGGRPASGRLAATSPCRLVSARSVSSARRSRLSSPRRSLRPNAASATYMA